MLVPVEDAREIILAHMPVMGIEEVWLNDALGRVLAQEVVAPLPLPHWDNSSVDGYAVRAEDVSGASPENPSELRLMGQWPAGQPGDQVVEPGACLRVFTGSPLPQGADAVVMQEDTRLVDDSAEARVWVCDKVRPFEHVRLAGEDIASGQQVLAQGRRLSGFDLGLVSALGIPRLKVRRVPRVGILATGTELVEPGQPLLPGQIHESNRLLLRSLLQRSGATPVVFPLIADDLERTTRCLEQALDQCDVLLTSGGVSVGDHDHIKPALQALGGKIHLWRLAMKPGKPLVFAEACHKPVFGLPGNPVSAVVGYSLLVYPALSQLAGCQTLDLPRISGTLTQSIHNRGDRRLYVRVRLEGGGRVVPSQGHQGSHALGSLATSDGLLAVAERTQLEAGSQVEVIGWP